MFEIEAEKRTKIEFEICKIFHLFVGLVFLFSGQTSGQLGNQHHRQTQQMEVLHAR